MTDFDRLRTRSSYDRYCETQWGSALPAGSRRPPEQYLRIGVADYLPGYPFVYREADSRKIGEARQIPGRDACRLAGGGICPPLAAKRRRYYGLRCGRRDPACRGGSLRQFDWRRMLTNFPIVFPTGVLEEAPQFRIMLTRVPSAEVSARFQQAVVQRYPNVSVIDLGLVLSVLEDILDKTAFVIRFSIITGVVVLIASVLDQQIPADPGKVLLRAPCQPEADPFYQRAEYFFPGRLLPRRQASSSPWPAPGPWPNIPSRPAFPRSGDRWRCCSDRSAC